MTVATRLRSAFAVYIALLAAALVYHVRTLEHAVDSGHALTEISSRLRVSSTIQLARLEQMSSDADKFLVTRDHGYLDKFVEASQAYGLGLRSLDAASLTDAERTAVGPLAANWHELTVLAVDLPGVEIATPDDARASVARLQAALDRVRGSTRQLAAASQDAMSRELTASEQTAREAERLSWIAAIGALLLSLLLSAMLIRSIVGPLERLAEGTREVAAGRFDYRLGVSGGDEFAQVTRDFNSMTERLDELDHVKRDFVAKVSHDLKTPLSSIQETIRVLLDELAGPLSPKQRQLLELNLESGQRLSGMLSKLLDVSRIEAGIAPEYQMVDVMQTVRRSVERASAAGSTRGARISLDELDRPAFVRGDEHGLAQVVDNLLENAIKFSPSSGVIEVSVAEWPSARALVPPERAAVVRWGGSRSSAVLLTVSDEGPGIPDDEKSRVFARFYQTDAGRAARGRGVGLGLAICLEIVTAHGGTMWVTDNEPRGSVFSVLLPGAAPAPEAAQEPVRAGGGGSVA